MDEKTRQQVREAIADHETAHPGWREEARERREREDRAAEARAHQAAQTRQQEQQQLRQRVETNNTTAWCNWVDERIVAHIKADGEAFVGAMGQVISEERQKHRRETKAAIDEVTRVFESKLAAMEQRLTAHPGKLPVATAWQPETVIYAGAFVTHEGATWQAARDTARKPGNNVDWLLIARAGRDAILPVIRGTYNVHEKYKMLDIVVLDGGSFIAIRDNPAAPCPGKDWQLLVKQGKAGRPGERGPVGPKGDKGDAGPAVMPQLVSSKIDENYTLTILRSDDSLEIIPLREAFERFWNETGGE